MRKLVKNFILDETGATAIEYGLIASLVCVVIIGGVTSFGNNLSTLLENLADTVNPEITWD